MSKEIKAKARKIAKRLCLETVMSCVLICNEEFECLVEIISEELSNYENTTGQKRSR